MSGCTFYCNRGVGQGCFVTPQRHIHQLHSGHGSRRGMTPLPRRETNLSPGPLRRALATLSGANGVVVPIEGEWGSGILLRRMG